MASEYLKWKYRDIKPDEKKVYTKKELRKNWWDYHKWHVVIGVVLLLILGDLLKSYFRIGVVEPDLQIAYVCSTTLSEDSITKLEDALEAYCEDLNGDGQVNIKINQYLIYSSENTQESEQAEYLQASQVSLLADIETNDSFLFILDDCVSFQESYDCLADTEGKTVGSLGSTNDKLGVQWKNCEALTSLELGNYEDTVLGEKITGNLQDLLENCYIARRAYVNSTPEYYDGLVEFWNKITKN